MKESENVTEWLLRCGSKEREEGFRETRGDLCCSVIAAVDRTKPKKELAWIGRLFVLTFLGLGPISGMLTKKRKF